MVVVELASGSDRSPRVARQLRIPVEDGEVTTLALTVNVEEGCELDEAPTTPAESGSMAPGGEAVLEHGSEEVVPSSQMSTVPVEGLVGPTAEDAGDTGCVPEEMTIAQYQAVYQQWVVGELADNEEQMQHGLGVLELLRTQYAVLQGAEEDTAQLLAGGSAIMATEDDQHAEQKGSRQIFE